MKRPVIALVAGVVVALVAALCWPQPWLLVSRGDALRYAFRGGDGTHFSLRWTHSVEEEDWIEEFAVRDQAIEIVATRFKTFGAGVPAHAGRATTLENGWVVMRGIDRVVDPLAVQAASAEHYRMRYGGRWFLLSKPGSEPILSFSNTRAPLYRVAGALWRGWRLQS
ncbi:DUF1850 domain-containing protein [Salinisphaera aquimarina]|uniref:DUF1850 domain-containing protein n=1 Tax=Salinisphaera aquimarina TaxID=2094031 RepID=A0ABV7ER70_9GAMM